MERAQRYYSEDDTHRGVTASQLKRVSRGRQMEYMRYWFHCNFEDPVHETPYNGREGGYLYIHGGPYNAHEELDGEFGSLIPPDRIEEIAKEIEAEDGVYDWAPGADHPDTRQRADEWYQDQNEQPSPAGSLQEIVDRLKSGIKPSYGDDGELEQRRIVYESLDQLRSALAHVMPTHGGMGHNRPPPDEDSAKTMAFVDARAAEATIRKELENPEPNALVVADATSRLQAALGWLFNKFDKAADSFAVTAGAAAAVAAGTVLVKAADISPALPQAMEDVIRHVTQWLSHVTTVF